MEDQELGGEVGIKVIDTKYYEHWTYILAQENNILMQTSLAVYTARHLERLE